MGSKDLEGTCKHCMDEQCIRFENIALDFSTSLLFYQLMQKENLSKFNKNSKCDLISEFSW